MLLSFYCWFDYRSSCLIVKCNKWMFFKKKILRRNCWENSFAHFENFIKRLPNYCSFPFSFWLYSVVRLKRRRYRCRDYIQRALPWGQRTRSNLNLAKYDVSRPMTVCKIVAPIRPNVHLRWSSQCTMENFHIAVYHIIIYSNVNHTYVRIYVCVCVGVRNDRLVDAGFARTLLKRTNRVSRPIEIIYVIYFSTRSWEVLIDYFTRGRTYNDLHVVFLPSVAVEYSVCTI
jgi:hypothetical protein